MNLQAIIDACERGILNIAITVVISNNSTSGAARRAKKHGIPFSHLSSHTHSDSIALDNAICSVLVNHKVDIVFLAGYMKKLGPNTISRFKGKILNTHPALLPEYGGKGMYGINVHNAVIDAKEKESGVTIHLVDQNYDTGKIINQCKIPVLPDDTPELLC